MDLLNTDRGLHPAPFSQFQVDVLAQISEAVIVLDNEQCVTWLNAAAAVAYAVEPVAILGQPLTELYEQRWLQPADEQAAAAALAETGRWRGETIHLKRNGTTSFVEATFSRLTDEAGHPIASLNIIRDISKCKQTEAALRASEALNRTLLAHSPDCIKVLDAAGRLLQINAPGLALLEIDEVEPFIGQSWATLWPPAAHELIHNALVVAGRGQSAHFQARGPTVKGTVKWWDVIVAPVPPGAGQPPRLLVLARDITAARQAEAALGASEMRLNTILQNIPAAVYMLTPDQRYLYVNRYYEQLVNITNAEIQGKSIDDIFAPETAAVLIANNQRTLAAKAPLEVEEYAPHEGELRTYHSIKTPLLADNGEPYAVVGISTDITERKRTEAALRQSEARYRTLFETMDEGFCVFELIFDEDDKPVDYRFLEINPAFARFTGLENALGKTARELVPNLEAHWFEIYGKVALTGEALRFVQGSAAMDRWFDVFAFRFGEPARRQVALLFNDITERKQAEAQLRSQDELLRQIADNVPGLIGYVGADERYRFINATFETWFQRPRQQIIGSTVHELIGVTAHTQLTTYRQQALAGKTISYETNFAYPDGVVRTVWGRYQPHLAADGTVLGFYLFIMDISERKQAEEQVRASEERFRQLAEAMPQIVWTCKADGALTYINAQWQAYSGLSLAQTLAEGMWPALHPEEQAANRRQWQHAVASGQPYEAEVRLRRTTGEYRWHLERAVPIRNDAGVIEQWFGASVDIDDYKRAQEALTRANERFALAEHASNGWVYDFDVQQGKAERSPGFSRILGYPPDEISPDFAWWYELLHPADRLLVADQAIRARGDAAFTEVEYRIRHHAGHYVHLLDRSRNIHNAAGQRVRVVGITVDISERKRAELHQQFLSTLGMQLRVLSDTDAMMAHLVKSLGHHLGVSGCRVNEVDLLQQQFTIQKDWAATGDAATGSYPLAELAPASLLRDLQAGQTVVVVNTATDPRTAPTVDHYRTQQTAALIGVPIARQGQWSATLSVRTQGERHWHQDEVALVEAVATQFQPLLEKVRAEQALQQFNEQLEQQVKERTAQLERSNRELDQFAYIAAHDLKAPLRGIEQLANWITTDAVSVLPESSRGHLVKLRERAQRMARLLDDLLAYSRVGRRDGAPQVVNTAALVKDVIALLAPPPGFTVQLMDELPELVTPRVPLEVVFRNLIGNVLKHHHDPQHGAVYISTQELGSFVEFCVRDNGPGIDPRYHERIFGVFQTLQPRDQVEGSGMGLALVKKAVEYRGGTIRLESAENQGAAFYFTWPKEVRSI